MSRLPSALVASGLLRAAEAVGGNGVVLARGDPDSGAMLLVLTTRGAHPKLFERVSSMRDGFTWNNHVLANLLDPQRVAQLIDGKKRFDPDLWIVELDVADPEQFVADSLS